jgi:PPOX class probable F420-dependent enzyme
VGSSAPVLGYDDTVSRAWIGVTHSARPATDRYTGQAIKKGVAPTFQDVIKSKYLLLTTFTKDGRPKPTAIWGVPEDGKLLVITDDGSWKTKRIKNTPRVTIAKSGALGKPKSDDVEGIARVLPKSETRRVYNAVLKRYWYHAPWFYVHSIVRGGIDKVHVGLEITEITQPVG